MSPGEERRRDAALLALREAQTAFDNAQDSVRQIEAKRTLGFVLIAAFVVGVGASAVLGTVGFGAFAGAFGVFAGAAVLVAGLLLFQVYKTEAWEAELYNKPSLALTAIEQRQRALRRAKADLETANDAVVAAE